MTNIHPPITPGEILRTEFLEPLGIDLSALADATGLPRTEIGEIVDGQRIITPGTALRLSKALGVDDRYWINVQVDHDLEVVRERSADDLAAVTVLVDGTGSQSSRPDGTEA